MDSIVQGHTFKSIVIGGKSVALITDAVVAMWIAMAVIMICTLVFTRKLKTIPAAGGQGALELYVEFITNFAKDRIGHRYRHFVAYLGTVLLFLFSINLIGLFNVIPDGKTLSVIFGNPSLEHFEPALHAPAKNVNVTACMALISIIMVIGAEIRFKGVIGWLKSFVQPTPISLLIKVLDYAVRPVSLCFRMFGNILGATIVMTLAYQALPILFPAAVGVYFELFDSGLQAYVFVFLTSMYIAEAVEEHEE